MKSTAGLIESAGSRRKPPWYKNLGIQVVLAMVVGIAVGFAFPQLGTSLKILGDLFLALIKAGVAPLIFFTIVIGIASAGDLKKASRIGLYALLYFEVVSTIALGLGLLAGNLFGVGKGVHAVAGSADVPTAAEPHSVADFLTAIVPDNFVGAFTGSQLLQVVVLSVIFGAGLLTLPAGVLAKVNVGLDIVSHTFFGFINVVMKLAPIGAFGAIAYSVGANGGSMLIALGELILQYWITIAIFIAVVLGSICAIVGIKLWQVLRFLKLEAGLVLSTASSESALPGLLEKLPRIGISKQVVGLVVPTGYAFNLDGTGIYMALCTLFIANVYGVPMPLSTQIGLLLIMLLTSKGAATVSGGTFVVFAATVAATGYLPVAGLPILFGVYRFMSMATAFCNVFGNVVATFAVARMTGELDLDHARYALEHPQEFSVYAETPELDAAEYPAGSYATGTSPEQGRPLSLTPSSTSSTSNTTENTNERA